MAEALSTEDSGCLMQAAAKTAAGCRGMWPWGQGRVFPLGGDAGRCIRQTGCVESGLSNVS